MISIIIPSKDRAILVQRALSSLRSQNLDSYQVVLINDGSRESYEKVKCSLAPDDIYLENKTSLGVSQARNQGIEAATNKWILFLDDDDEVRPSYLEVLLSSIKLNPSIDFFWSDIVVYLAKPLHNISRVERVWPRQYWNEDHLYSTALSIGTSFGLAVRKQKLLDIGLFDNDLSVGEDIDLIIRLLNSKAKPKPIPYFGINKFEISTNRLSFGYKTYSSEKIFEIIFSKNSEFFREQKYCKATLIYFAASVHAAYKDVKSEKLLLNELFKAKYYRMYFEYKLQSLIKGPGYLLNLLT